MRENMRQVRRRGTAVAVAVVVAALGFVPESAHAQRRGRTMVPQKPANVVSTPMIEGLNKALKALGETDLDYDGHREKAIAHIGKAIHQLELPTARGRSDGAVSKAAVGKAPARAGTTPKDASDASLHKALTALFAVHHKLSDHSSSVGRIHADAEVRIAIQEIGYALKPPAAAAAPAHAPAATPTKAAR